MRSRPAGFIGGIVADDIARTAVHTNKIRLRRIELKQTLGGGDLSTGRSLVKQSRRIPLPPPGLERKADRVDRVRNRDAGVAWRLGAEWILGMGRCINYY